MYPWPWAWYVTQNDLKHLILLLYLQSAGIPTIPLNSVYLIIWCWNQTQRFMHAGQVFCQLCPQPSFPSLRAHSLFIQITVQNPRLWPPASQLQNYLPYGLYWKVCWSQYQSKRPVCKGLQSGQWRGWDSPWGDRKVLTVKHLRYQGCGRAKTCPWLAGSLLTHFISWWDFLLAVSRLFLKSLFCLYLIWLHWGLCFHFLLELRWDSHTSVWVCLSCLCLLKRDSVLSPDTPWGCSPGPTIVNEKQVWPSESTAVSDLSMFVSCFRLSHTLRSQALTFRFCSENVWFLHKTRWLKRTAFRCPEAELTVVSPRLTLMLLVS